MLKVKNLLVLLLAVSCVFTITSGVLASDHTTTLGTTNGSLVYNSNDTENVHIGSHTCHYRVSSFTFHGGLPANTFPSSTKNFTVRFANIGISKKYTSVDTSYKSKSYSVSSNKTVYAGVETNHSSGITVFLSWNPNY